MPSMCISANEEPEKILPAGLTLEPPRWWRGARIPRFCESWIVGSLTPKEGLLSPFLQVPSLSMKWWWKFLLIKKKKSFFLRNKVAPGSPGWWHLCMDQGEHASCRCARCPPMWFAQMTSFWSALTAPILSPPPCWQVCSWTLAAKDN